MQNRPSMPPGTMSIANKFMGGSGGGMGMPYSGIAAAIAAQHLMAMNNNRTFEGQRSGDVFTGDFLTEPWFAFASDRLGLPTTAGEKFDAAIKNKDWNAALKRLPEATDYWADPIRSWAAKGGEALLGEDNIVSKILNPIELIKGLFS